MNVTAAINRLALDIGTSMTTYISTNNTCHINKDISYITQQELY